MAYPMVDLIGPNVILVTEDQTALLATAGSQIFLNHGARPGRRRLTALILSPPFSSRISSMPFHEHAYELSAPRAQNKPAHFQFKEPDGPGRPLRRGDVLKNINGGPIALPTPVAPRRAGVTALTIVKPLAAGEFSRISEALRKNDKTVTHDIRSRAKELDHKGMDFRYPPMPPVDGFNVFGLLDQLKLSIASGHLMIGAKSVSIDAPSVLHFKNIKAFSTRGNVIPIPLVANQGKQSLEFSVEATSEVYLNDKALTVKEDMYRIAVEYVVPISSIICGLSGLVALWQILGRRV